MSWAGNCGLDQLCSKVNDELARRVEYVPLEVWPSV